MRFVLSAKLWGFTGEMDSDWLARPHECDGCDCPPNVVFVQQLTDLPS